ncbi:carboxypeptidase-like regulatory domain-containing protein [Geobacter sp.]|uniref:carboxypeptidase-like regulatory domain-containing protein n=1 Tax=Geobacter sp. TaxID=46610 RepID=UPI001AC3229F|nr:carboxypeptidase-like regulatory domain-containing protein [Geobacter sp.]CAG1014906.1 hypothetical protein ANAEL_05114 [Anaerolineales bacterium]
MVRMIFIIFILIPFIVPNVAIAEREVYGTVLDKAGKPVAGARVNAWDSDVGSDQKMGEAVTNQNGAYKIQYRGGAWDGRKTSYHTQWRPDIYVTVEIKDEQNSPWYKAARSKIYQDHHMSENLKVDLVTFTMDLPEGCLGDYEMEVWKKDAIVEGNSLDHTATRTRIYQNCGGKKTLLSTVDKCNHGACPGEKWMSKRREYKTGPRPGDLVFPVGCHVFGLKEFGLVGDNHVCNNDSFMQMGIVVSGKMPHNKTINRICKNKNYTDYTGRDPKYIPSFDNVKEFISKYGWDTPQEGASGGGGGGSDRPPIKPK